MNSNLVTVSNLAESATNNIEKKSYNNIGVAGSITFALFAGMTILKCPTTGEIVPKNDYSKPSYIQYIDLEEKKGLFSVENNKIIDLMKVDNLNKIKKMARFENDWNGTGGSAFSEGAINLFIEIIEMLDKQPGIAPTGRNSLLMQYELDNKSLLAFEVSENKTEKVYVPEGDYSMAQMELFTENVGFRIKESVENFYGFK